MTKWFIQHNPEKYSLKKHAKISKIEWWGAKTNTEKPRFRKYVKQIKKGEYCIFWQSGENSGIAGYGKIVKGIDEEPSDEIHVEYYQILDKIITMEEIQYLKGYEEEFLGDLGTSGTYFPIPEPEGWNFFKKVIETELGIDIEKKGQNQKGEIISDELYNKLLDWKQYLLREDIRNWNNNTMKAEIEFQKMLEVVQFKAGGNFNYSHFKKMFEYMRRYSRNIGLQDKLFSDLDFFNKKLRRLYYGEMEFPDRVEEFLSIKGIGNHTLSQFLVLFNPKEYPIITEPMKEMLDLNENQKEVAMNKAIKYWNIRDLEKYSHKTIIFLRDFIIMKEIKDLLQLDKFDLINKLLWEARITQEEEISDEFDDLEYLLPDFLYFTPDIQEKLQYNITKLIANNFHIILIGPPGTGKTKLAKDIVEQFRGDECTITTATSDWTTSETIGSYFPEEDSNNISFKPGLFLQCFPKNQLAKWLIIDEINRADIDKAFGYFFTVLAGDRVVLPYTRNGKPIEIIPEEKLTTEDQKRAENVYIVPQDWKIIATMNTFDKSSLYEMSYAFMRRFAFVYLDIPKNVNNPEIIQGYLKAWEFEPDVDNTGIETVFELWQTINEYRKIGPAVIKDIIDYGFSEDNFLEVLKLFVIPQLEGLEDERLAEFIISISVKFDSIEREDLVNYINEFFDLTITLEN